MSSSEFRLTRDQIVPAAIEDVFRFFSEPRNLEEITPAWMRLRVVACSTPVIGEGTSIDYDFRLRGIPLRWRSRIREWDPPRGFVDEQVSGPYRSWIHVHRFERAEGGTRVRDEVRYSVLGGRLVERWLVRPDLERIFAYRQERLEQRFSRRARVP